MRFPLSAILFFISMFHCSLDVMGSVIVKYDFNGNVLDTSGNGNHGSIVGNPVFQPSSRDSGIYFTNPAGSANGNQYVTIPNTTDILGLGNSSFTIAIFYRSVDNSMNNGRLFGQFSSGSGVADHYNAGGTPGAYAYFKDTSGNILSTKGEAVTDPRAITTDGVYRWTFSVLDREQKQLRYYVDDNLITTVGYTNFGPISFADLRIGMINFSVNYAARLTLVDEFRMYSTPLTFNEIQGVVGSVPEPSSALSVCVGFVAIFLKKSRRRGKPLDSSKVTQPAANM
jgi:hypothetical protein